MAWTIPGGLCARALRCAAALTVLVGLATLASAGVASAASGASAITWRSGVFAGYGPSGDAAFGTWRGAPVTSATDFLPSDNWTQMEDPAWAIGQWGPVTSVWPDLSVAPWPASGGNLADAAAGAYDAHFAALARSLVAGGLGGAGIRLGWEFNGSWYRWSVRSASDAALFAQAWRGIVTAMRSVPGAHFQFDWALSAGASTADPALAYPGDAYVDDIGMDVYDWNPSGSTESPTQRWNGIVNESYGLAWQANFASAHHKPIAFPEWGVVNYAVQPSAAGGDDPTFVQNMVSWFRTHDVSFENYFDADATSLGMSYGLTTGNGLFPKSAVTYQQLYSATLTPTPTSTPTPTPTPRSPVKPKSTTSTKKVSKPLGTVAKRLGLARLETSYQARLRWIDRRFAHVALGPAQASLVLRRVLRAYAGLKAPAPLRPLHAELVAAVTREQEGLAEAAASARNHVRLRRAEAEVRRARRTVTLTHRRINAVIGACRANAARC
jgi:hypothetical protein